MDVLDRLGIGPPAAPPKSNGRAQPPAASKPPAPILPKVAIRRLSDVKPETLEWLWPGRIPLGKLTLLAGDPGLGKSFVTLDMAARVSNGSGWPDDCGAKQAAGSVVLFSAEDDLRDTIRPRLDRAGADVTRIIAVEGIRWTDAETAESGTRCFSLERDLHALEGVIAETADARLVVIDPISAYCGRADSHKNSEIRGLLAPLAELAARFRLAVVAVTHLSKGGAGKAVYRAMGSLAFAAAARAVWAVAKDQSNPTRRLILPVKMNLSPDPTGLAYSIDDGAVAWEAEPVRMTADDAFSAEADRERGGESSEWREAGDWLVEVLTDGPVAAKEIKSLARVNGIGEKPLRTAKERLGIVSQREGFGTGSRVLWAMPGSIDAQDDHRCPSKNTGIYGAGGHLWAGNGDF
jgi:archaellum biogenesis ATPase FlaH